VSIFCNPIIEIFDTDGKTRLVGPINNGGEWEDESWDWTCPEDGIYFIKITNANSNFGETVKYDLKLYIPAQGDSDLLWNLTGMVLNALDQPISGVEITSDKNTEPVKTFNDGTYWARWSTGPHNITVEAPGYISEPREIELIDEEGLKTENFTLYASDGDKDLDGMTDEWEDQYDLDPEFPDGHLDYDDDGFRNYLEFLRDTDPLDPNSHPPGLPWLMLLLGDD
ncbi:carboxypeptidase regulatory-like domain-containing protein, partial [Thermodesulfobacteriota bacterium]